MKRTIRYLFIMFIILVGCAGLGNKSYLLQDGYSVMYISAYNAKLIYDETGTNTSGSTVVPEMVVRINENDRYIIAEQELLIRGKPNGEYTYWIEDKLNRAIVGRALDFDDFQSKLNELSINDLELLDVKTFPVLEE
ncbi:DUF3997 domain-containing protein [Alkalihalobacillus sp. LMS6]|uniref:DUF3997 domain-containing protein n=1 Tax=Bacillaceae TaxID=186817 RepID=UPI000C06CB37|nr:MULTISPECIES: DUF3997 domain-containing protein [Bacillaceae]UTR07117.1 DUF3997 domain-containing protein [Alkalihalobacillus sp. LMS6]